MWDPSSYRTIPLSTIFHIQMDRKPYVTRVDDRKHGSFNLSAEDLHSSSVDGERETPNIRLFYQSGGAGSKPLDFASFVLRSKIEKVSIDKSM